MPKSLRYAALAALLVPAVAAGESRAPYGGVASGSFLGAPSTLDPVEVRSHADLTLVSLLFDTLYRIGPGGEVEPHLAAALPELSEDGTSARIRLIPGITFHDGGELGAEDAARSLRRAKRSEAAWLLAPVASVRADEGELVLDLLRPAPDLPAMLSAPQTAITRWGRAPSARRARGTGPFRLLGFRDGRVSLARFDRHFAGAAYLRRLDLRWFQSPDAEARAYEAGDAHLSFRGDVAFSGHKPKYRTDLAESPAAVLVYVGFCAGGSKLVTDDHFRQALSLALGRGGFRNIGTGERVVPSVHPASPDLGGPKSKRRTRRPRLSRARRELARARRRRGDLGSVELELLVDRSRPDDREVAGKVAAVLFKLGLSARITELAPGRFTARVEPGRCDLYVGQLAAPLPLPVFQVAAAFAAGGDDWAEKRLAVGELRLAEALQLFARRLPILPLFHRAVRAHHRSNLHGVEFGGAGRLSYADLFLFGPARKHR